MLNKVKCFKLLFSAVTAVSLLFLYLTISGCDDSLDLQDEVTWKKVCTQWGVPASKVQNVMRTYTRKNATPTVLTYKGKGSVEAISYQFAEDSLCAVVVLMGTETVGKSDVCASFSGYESLGESNSSELFVDYRKNTLVTVTAFTKDEKEYISVGYADMGGLVKDSDPLKQE